MTSTTSPAAASSADTPGSDEPASTDPATPASLLRQEVAVRRHLTHILGVELRRRLIPLVRANLVPLDVACRVLQGAGLPPLPTMWTVHLAPAVTRRGSYSSVDQAITAFHHDLDRAVKKALGAAVTIEYPQPPQALTATDTQDGDDTGSIRYDIEGNPVLTAPVRAETRHQAQAHAVELLRAAIAGLPGVEADLSDPGAVYVEPAEHLAVELDVDTDAPYQTFTPPPAHGSGLHITEARTARRLALQAWQYQVRRIRAGLIDALIHGELDEQPGRHGHYGLVDDLLRELGLPGLPHAHLYEITAAIPVTVTADNPVDARRAAHSLVRDASAVHAQYGLPITYTNTFREPNIVAAGAGSYRVTWHETYLVCLRATHSPRLAESAVRLQLSVLADEVPDIATVPLTTADFGEYIDHRLEPDRD
jgi:hypothetical protein